MRIERRSGRNAWGEWENYVAIDDSGIEIRINLEEMTQGNEFQLFANGGYSLHWAAYSAEGKRVAQGSDWSTTPTNEELRALDATAKELIRFRVAQGSRFIRYGRLPKSGRSKNHATGETEQGVSCYRATFNPFTQVWELSGSALPTAAIAGALGIYDSVWLVSGEMIGIGSDGEPLLRKAKVEAELHYDPKAEGYKPV